MNKSVFESAGFRHDVRFRPEDREYGAKYIKVFISFVIVVALVIGMLLFRFIGISEPFANTYDYTATSKKDLMIYQGSFVFYAPVTSEDSYVGDLPEDLVLHDVVTYIPEFKANSSEESYIGVDASHFQKYLGDEFHLEKDRDGVIWIQLSRVRILPSDTVS